MDEKMTVEQLITNLKTFDQMARVVVRGYEGGYGDASQCRTLNLRLNHNDAWYYGPHEESVLDNEPYDEIAVCIE